MIESAPALAKSSILRSGRSTIRCTSSAPPRSCTSSRSASTIRAPIEIGGTKWPSITSTWITRAPASMTASTCSPRRAKCDARIDGATRTSIRRSWAGTAGRPYQPRPSLRGILGAVLGAVLDLVERGDVAPVDVLAVVVEHVELVGPDAVDALPAVDAVDLAVAHAEAVASVAAVELVAVGIAERGDVEARQRPQHI